MSEKYSKTLPTVPGWYWSKDSKGVEAIVDVSPSLCVNHIPVAHLAWQWSGPLTPPESE